MSRTTHSNINIIKQPTNWVILYNSYYAKNSVHDKIHSNILTSWKTYWKYSFKHLNFTTLFYYCPAFCKTFPQLFWQQMEFTTIHCIFSVKVFQDKNRLHKPCLWCLWHLESMYFLVVSTDTSDTSNLTNNIVSKCHIPSS